MAKYPPYVDSYGQVKELFKKIKEASVPSKFTQDFLAMVLELKSSSFRPMIPFLKRLGFLDESNIPTKAYVDFRDEEKSAIIMAKQVKKSYDILFMANEYAQKLTKDQVVSKLVSLLGVSKDDQTVPKVAATFVELVDLSDFEGKIEETQNNEEKEEKTEAKEKARDIVTEKSNTKIRKEDIGISYTINLNLPATTNIEVFDSIFRSLKENLLR